MSEKGDLNQDSMKIPKNEGISRAILKGDVQGFGNRSE